ncbi:glycosyltransferase [Adlercreutzia sp. ZJ304]|uniref:glycosyltransferase family 2 protein n=1 Tax=Adlercreutzia sp. ZJ304 TaxID=2709791 RepID=UPI0013ED76D1|nr:glycosyltransferase [Adlercreutzia sp. ZJ304]
MRTITFAVPCYNSAEYMDKCIESLLDCGEDIEIIIVNDGSTDNTAEKADAWHQKYPDIIRAIHKENGGHGSAVNTGLANAKGLYYKVVDSDDWLDAKSMGDIMTYLRKQSEVATPTDLVIANYVYEKVFENTRTEIRYNNVFPENRVFTWSDVGSFNHSQYLLMHSVIYRTDLLLDINLQLPEHCFYVDNIFVYVPLPHVRSMYYIDTPMYRYFIGREGQSVNESVMMNRIDQHLRVVREMIDDVDVMSLEPRRLRKYMESYLSMMMCIASVFLRMRNTQEDDRKLADIWEYLKRKDQSLYRRIRSNVLNLGTNIPTELGRKVGLGGYHLAQRIFHFN